MIVKGTHCFENLWTRHTSGKDQQCCFDCCFFLHANMLHVEYPASVFFNRRYPYHWWCGLFINSHRQCVPFTNKVFLNLADDDFKVTDSHSLLFWLEIWSDVPLFVILLKQVWVMGRRTGFLYDLKSLRKTFHILFYPVNFMKLSSHPDMKK